MPRKNPQHTRGGKPLDIEALRRAPTASSAQTASYTAPASGLKFAAPEARPNFTQEVTDLVRPHAQHGRISRGRYFSPHNIFTTTADSDTAVIAGRTTHLHEPDDLAIFTIHGPLPVDQLLQTYAKVGELPRTKGIALGADMVGKLPDELRDVLATYHALMVFTAAGHLALPQSLASLRLPVVETSRRRIHDKQRLDLQLAAFQSPHSDHLALVRQQPYIQSDEKAHIPPHMQFFASLAAGRSDIAGQGQQLRAAWKENSYGMAVSVAGELSPDLANGLAAMVGSAVLMRAAMATSH